MKELSADQARELTAQSKQPFEQLWEEVMVVIEGNALTGLDGVSVEKRPSYSVKSYRDLLTALSARGYQATDLGNCISVNW